MSPPWTYRIWPGLPRLWFRGDFHALIQAWVFGALLAVWLLTTLRWTGWLEGTWRIALGGCLVAWWLWEAFRSGRPGFLGTSQRAQDAAKWETEWCELQRAYLQGQWTDAERTLRTRLALVPRDVQAGLMLIRVLRRAGNVGEAQVWWQRLRGYDEAAAWWTELDREGTILAQLLSEPEDQVAEDEGSPVAESAPGHHDGETETSELDENDSPATIPLNPNVGSVVSMERSLRIEGEGRRAA